MTVVNFLRRGISLEDNHLAGGQEDKDRRQQRGVVGSRDEGEAGMGRRSHWATYLYMSSRARAASTTADKEREASENRENRVVRARLSGAILTKGQQGTGERQTI